MFEWNTLIYIVIPVIHRNYDANDALTANIHVVIPVIDQNYDINGIVRENLAKSRELYRNSGHSPELGY
jgi:cellulose biosynthesis protein BcsQ